MKDLCRGIHLRMITNMIKEQNGDLADSHNFGFIGLMCDS
jgi:hypothetical protein